MPRLALIATFLVAAAFAGCSGDDSQDDTPAAGETTTSETATDNGETDGPATIVELPETLPETLPSGRDLDLAAHDVTPPDGSRAATGLKSQVGCKAANPSQGAARLTWSLAPDRGTEQRVAVTIFQDGFARGDLDMSRPLQPGQTELTWERLRGQANHFWIVLTLHEDEWVASEPAKFTGVSCALDYVTTQP
jgi:hypothetical protein